MSKFKKGDVVRVFNSTLNGRLIYEGKGAIVRAYDTEDYYEVRFPDGDFDRFVSYGSGEPLPPEFQKAVDEAKAEQAA